MYLAGFKKALILFLLSFAMQAQSTDSTFRNPYLQRENQLFTTKLTFRDMTFTGYLGLKYKDARNFRLSFTSSMGSTLLDLEWKDGKFIKHYVPEKLDRPLLLNKLQADFELIFMHILAEGRWKGPEKVKLHCHKYLLSENEAHYLTGIEDRGWLGGLKRSLNLQYSDGEKLSFIQLKHHNFALQIELTPIE